MSLENYGSYQLIKRLAMGGMAQIYLARRKGGEASDKLVVVKRILPHLAENLEFVRMFLDEARIAARLAHPNIVQIHDLGAQDDSFFLAMEYIHGEDVRRMSKRAEGLGHPLPVPLACRIIIDACAGLDYAHKKTDPAGKPLGIVHRDVSPQNILVSFEGAVKVVDFGIAKAADQATVTRSGVLKGKYSYMSPEQAAGKRVDCRSDVFALGVVLYELITGTRLFKRASDMQTLSAVAECQVTPPSQLSPRVPADLDPIVMKALAKEPDARFSEALQLQVALEEWVAAHRLPASTADLAAFMQEVYAERLAREARAGGQVLVDEDPPTTGQRPALDGQRRSGGNPSVSSKEVTRADRGELAAASASGIAEVTDRSPPRPVRPSRSIELRREPEVERTRQERRTVTPRQTDARRPEPEPRAAPRPEPEPPRAMPPELDAPSLSVTDTTRIPSRALEAALAARRRRRWGLAGAAVFVSATVVAALLWVLLAPGAPPPLARVQLETVPPGARVLFDGKALPEVTPLSLPPVAAGSYPVVLSREGHQELRTTVVVPSTGPMTLTLRLVAAAPPPEKAPEPAPEPEVVPPPTASEPVQPTPAPEPAVARPLPKASPPAPAPIKVTRAEPPKPVVEPSKALVRFAVTPWAEVSCGGRNLGQTPFEAVELPVGVYQCRFHNPELGRTLTQRIEVKPTGLNKVVVKF